MLPPGVKLVEKQNGVKKDLISGSSGGHELIYDVSADIGLWQLEATATILCSQPVSTSTQ